MKNAALAWIGGIWLIALTVLLLSVYETGSRRNELENQLSRLVKKELETYYGQVIPSEQVKEELTNELKNYCNPRAHLTVELKACDMEKGILSVIAESAYLFPNGEAGKVSCERTAIMDRIEE